ncbi:MAG: hypothetical protein HYW23_03950 [Candidatus Aenigmarchaeota archaeon]|nr:hypothetical protein [Candidatus Aenigmarchaeota archaeon]
MGICLPLFSFLASVYVNVLKVMVQLFAGGGGTEAILIAFIGFAGVIYVFTKFFGKIGPMILIGVGVLGSLVTGGVLSVLIVIGFIGLFVGQATSILLMSHAAAFALSVACYGV